MLSRVALAFRAVFAGSAAADSADVAADGYYVGRGLADQVATVPCADLYLGLPANAVAVAVVASASAVAVY